MRAMALLGLLFASCGTASYVEVVSSPAGARIFVEGVDTGQLTPARIDLEDHAPDPDRPMRIEVRLAGFVPSVSVPYPARHRCGPLPCPKQRQTYLPCRLAMFETGGGVRIDTHYDDAFEVSFDDGEWLPVAERSAWAEDSAGRTFDLPPGRHTLRYRPLLPDRRRSVGSDTWTIAVPEQGYLAIILRWSPTPPREPPLAQ